MPVEDTGSKKHPLTPSAKEREPPSKRQALGEGMLGMICRQPVAVEKLIATLIYLVSK